MVIITHETSRPLPMTIQGSQFLPRAPLGSGSAGTAPDTAAARAARRRAAVASSIGSVVAPGRSQAASSGLPRSSLGSGPGGSGDARRSSTLPGRGGRSLLRSPVTGRSLLLALRGASTNSASAAASGPGGLEKGGIPRRVRSSRSPPRVPSGASGGALGVVEKGAEDVVECPGKVMPSAPGRGEPRRRASASVSAASSSEGTLAPPLRERPRVLEGMPMPRSVG
jgi:hypothetical protein